MADPPRVDVAARRLWASPRHLGVLAQVAVEGPATLADGPAAGLADAGVLSCDGEVIPALRPVAAAAASAVGVARVTRLRGTVTRQVQVRVGPDGVLVAPSDDDDTVGEIALQPPTTTCRTLWRLLHLGPRPRPARPRDLGPVPTDHLVAGVRGDDAGLRRLGVGQGPAVLDRVELRTAPGDTGPAGLALLDTPGGCWRLEGPDAALTLHPVDAVELLDVLAGWQLALVGPDGDALATADGARLASLRRIALDDGDVHVALPGDWERLPPTPGLPLLARQREGSGFRVNVTVAPERGADGGHDPVAVAEALAAGLDGGVAVDGWGEPGGGTSVIVVHAAPGTDVVTLQRRLPTTTGVAAVSYTCAVTQWPSWSGVLRHWASQATSDRSRAGGRPS